MISSVDLRKNSGVAVLMAVCGKDNAQYFEHALRSIRAQTFPQDRIQLYLGIDGALTPELEAVVSQHISRIRLCIRNESNEGLASILNRLIDSLEGEDFVFRMDADDISEPQRFAKQIRFMLENPNVDVLGTDVLEIDSNEEAIGRRHYPVSHTRIRTYITKASPVAHPTVCFRGDFFLRFGRYSAQYRTSQDIDLWFNALRHGAVIANLPEPHLRLRVVDDFYSRRSLNKAWSEFRIYLKGIWSLHGLTWRYVYPFARLFFRILPVSLIRLVYRGPLRRRLLNEIVNF